MTEIWNLNTLCRCCHSDGCFKSLKETHLNGTHCEEIYELMLQDTLGIWISQPPVEASYTICDTCIERLRDAHIFKQQVLMCENKFGIYCRNEQFLTTITASVKSEVDDENDYSEDVMDQDDTNLCHEDENDADTVKDDDTNEDQINDADTVKDDVTIPLDFERFANCKQNIELDDKMVESEDNVKTLEDNKNKKGRPRKKRPVLRNRNTHSKTYRCCGVPLCSNTSIKTPEKLFISVPFNKTMRNKWLKHARRDLKGITPSTQLYFCEDHFDLPSDMENYMQYHVMGSVSQIRMKKGCVPLKFYCQPDRRKRASDSMKREYFAKKQRKELIAEFEQELLISKNTTIAIK